MHVEDKAEHATKGVSVYSLGTTVTIKQDQSKKKAAIQTMKVVQDYIVFLGGFHHFFRVRVMSEF